MDTGLQQRYRTSAGYALLWYGLLAAPLAFVAHTFINYALVQEVCSNLGRYWLHAVSGIVVAATLSGSAAAWSAWQHGGRRLPDDSPDVLTRVRFLGALGLSFSALIAAVIAAQWLATLYVDPCMR